MKNYYLVEVWYIDSENGKSYKNTYLHKNVSKKLAENYILTNRLKNYIPDSVRITVHDLDDILLGGSLLLSIQHGD